MRGCLKVLLGICITAALCMGVLVASFMYVTEYKVTECDMALSDDGRYELRLQAVGEPDWPFGKTPGRLVLLKEGREIARRDFALRDDGCTLSAGNWSVNWKEEYVEITLSGEEQEDETVRLSYTETAQP